MKKEKSEMKLFLERIEKYLENREADELDMEAVKRIPVNDLECYYLFDYKKNEILFHRGFDTVFGYALKKLGIDFIFQQYHPDDAPFIKNIIKGSVDQLMDVKVPEYANLISMAYRFRKNDGTYARILSNTTVHQTGKQDRISSVLVKYTDISFVDQSDVVEWMVNTNYLDLENIRSTVYDNDHANFTSREIQVIRELFNGHVNKEIALILHISEHTVATHRKNILLKSKCSSVQELNSFCKKNGLLL